MIYKKKKIGTYHCVDTVVSLIAIELIFIIHQATRTADGDMIAVYKAEAAWLLLLTIEENGLVILFGGRVRPVDILRQMIPEVLGDS